jgi:hypothetical protein
LKFGYWIGWRLSGNRLRFLRLSFCQILLGVHPQLLRLGNGNLSYGLAKALKGKAEVQLLMLQTAELQPFQPLDHP